MPFKDLIQFVIDGQLVSAGVTNRAPRDLQGNIEYLRQVLEDALLGSTIFVRDATVELDAQEGQPVYWNSTDQEYKRAKATVATDANTGALITGPSSWTWGVIYRKLSATKADILVGGVAEVDLSQAITGTPAAGMYYLSATTSGKLTAQEPPVTVPVLMVGQEGTGDRFEVLVRPDFRDLITGHKHHRYALQCVPAGTHSPPTGDERHTITNADSSVEGWLPADDAVFESKAPSGAKFGYNLSVGGLTNLWPPIPVSGATLELYHPDAQSATSGQPITGGPVPTELCVLDENGIWWLEDCQGQVPWPTNYDSESSESISESDTCPESLSMEATLWFSRVDFFTNNTAVLSLAAKADSGLVVTCRGTEDAASTGHLDIDLDFNLLVDETDKTGYLAFKELTSAGKFNLGPVVEALKAGSANITLSGSETDANGFVCGKITVSVDRDVDETKVPFETIRLDGAEEKYYQGVIGVGLASDHETGLVGRLKIPDAAALPLGTTMKLRLLVLARAAGTIPADVFTCSYRRISRPANPLTPVALPTTDTAFTIDSNVAVTEDNYIEMESEEFTIADGDVVLINLYRAGSDGFGGDLHIIHKQGILVEN